MSLEDRFSSKDNSIITKYDTMMVKAATFCGDLYQELTGEDYKKLVLKSYSTSILVSYIASVTNPFNLIMAAMYYESKKHPDFLTPLEEEVECESLGKNKNIKKYGRLLMPLAGLAVSLDAYSEFIEAKNTLSQIINTGQFIQGASLLPFVFGKYLSLAILPKPPEKKFLTRLQEKLLEYAPIPQQEIPL